MTTQSLWICLFLAGPFNVCIDRSTYLSLHILFLQTSAYRLFLSLWKQDDTSLLKPRENIHFSMTQVTNCISMCVLKRWQVCLTLPKFGLIHISDLVKELKKIRRYHSHDSFCIISIHWHRGAGYVQQWNTVCLRDVDMYDLFQHVLCHVFCHSVSFPLHIWHETKCKELSTNTTFYLAAFNLN